MGVVKMSGVHAWQSEGQSLSLVLRTAGEVPDTDFQDHCSSRGNPNDNGRKTTLVHGHLEPAACCWLCTDVPVIEGAV